MTNKAYDATTEFRPFERSGNPSKNHPRPRKGQTAKKAKRALGRREEAAKAPAPAKKKK